jgi:hypothetical protein
MAVVLNLGNGLARELTTPNKTIYSPLISVGSGLLVLPATSGVIVRDTDTGSGADAATVLATTAVIPATDIGSGAEGTPVITPKAQHSVQNGEVIWTLGGSGTSNFTNVTIQPGTWTQMTFNVTSAAGATRAELVTEFNSSAYGDQFFMSEIYFGTTGGGPNLLTAAQQGNSSTSAWTQAGLTCTVQQSTAQLHGANSFSELITAAFASNSNTETVLNNIVVTGSTAYTFSYWVYWIPAGNTDGSSLTSANTFAVETGTVTVVAADTGTGIDTATVLATTSDTDAGSGSDQAAVLISSPDTGVATDNAALTASLFDQDVTSSVEFAALEAFLSVNDTSSGLELAEIVLPASDTLSGTDAGLVFVRPPVAGRRAWANVASSSTFAQVTGRDMADVADSRGMEKVR